MARGTRPFSLYWERQQKGPPRRPGAGPEPPLRQHPPALPDSNHQLVFMLFEILRHQTGINSNINCINKASKYIKWWAQKTKFPKSI